MKENMDTRDLSEFYDQVYKKGDIRDNSRLYRWVVRLIHPVRGKNLLDVGCGVGCLLSEAALSGLRPFGLDISLAALVKAKENLKTDSLLAVADGENIPFRDSVFDRVVSLGSLEHFLSPQRGIQEIYRVLKKGGRAAFILPNSFYLGDILKVLFKGSSDEQWQIQEKVLSKGQWRQLLEKNKFRVDKIYGYNKFPEFFQPSSFKIKSIKKYVKRLLLKYLCPLNLSWQFLYLCRK
jgi:ubiquinone/menaquinone biosynthesis C-methylase UbiE